MNHFNYCTHFKHRDLVRNTLFLRLKRTARNTENIVVWINKKYIYERIYNVSEYSSFCCCRGFWCCLMWFFAYNNRRDFFRFLLHLNCSWSALFLAVATGETPSAIFSCTGMKETTTFHKPIRKRSTIIWKGN